MDAAQKLDPEDRLIVGANDIGQFLGLTPRQAYHALSKGYLPGKKLGKQWTSTPRRLRPYAIDEVDSAVKSDNAAA